jgi:hypothetical protein
MLCAALIAGLAAWLSAGQAQAQLHGMYTDKAVYEPGDTIEVYASAPDSEQIPFAMIRHGETDEAVLQTDPVAVEGQPTRVGSFVEVDGLELGGRSAFTLEGWWYPTLVGGDQVMVAGQGDFERGAGLFVTEQARLGAYVDAEGVAGSALRILRGEKLAIDQWHHIALTYDSSKLVLYLDGEEVASAAGAGAVVPTSAPFRVGAGPEAPGDLTGVIDGRVDSWALWPRALSAAEIEGRHQSGQSEADPAPAADAVELYLGFEDPYGDIADGSRHGHDIEVINHGTPRVVGVHQDGFAMRLNHDQLVDAHWRQTATIEVPKDATTGLYTIESPDPDFQELRWPPLQTSVVVRPPAPRQEARVAVVVPTNTWVAYNAWPGYNFRGPPVEEDYFTQRKRTPEHDWPTRSGNNSAYQKMGDGVSHALFQGWRRPNASASVEDTAGYEFDLRAKMSLEVVQWLEQNDIDYDLYTDWDVGDGRIQATDYRVVFVHGHSEYWSRRALDHARDFADAGGSFIFMSGNSIYWHVAHSDDHLVQEGRKWPTFVRPIAQGENDRVTAIDGQKSGLWELISQCDGATASPTLLQGSLFDIQTGGHPSTFGRWEVQNAGHWLWPDDVGDGDHVGESRYDDIYTVGHEADSYDPMRPPPGLAPGAPVSVLAEGVDFPKPEFASHRRNLSYRPDCDEIEAVHAGEMEPSADKNLPVTEDTRAGSILHYRHAGGGHVLNIGSTASVWALQSDAAISGMVERAIDCFAYDSGCPDEPFEPSKPTVPGSESDVGGISDAGAGDDADEGASGGRSGTNSQDTPGCSTASGGLQLTLFIGLMAALAVYRGPRRG